MVHGIDIAITINTTLKMITKQIGIEEIPTIICTDSFSLYKCIVKLGTTKEKRLIIDIMAIRQSYEQRELSEIRWICSSPLTNAVIGQWRCATEQYMAIAGWSTLLANGHMSSFPLAN
jgi:hypothetical protein